MNKMNKILSHVGLLDKINLIDENIIGVPTIKQLEEAYPNFPKKCGKIKWNYQQFLKIQYANICQYDSYIIWDGDSIPLKPIRFFTDDGKTIMHLATHARYASFIRFLKVCLGKKDDGLDLTFPGRWSYVCEHMIFDVDVMKNMASKICLNLNCGSNIWDSVLSSLVKLSGEGKTVQLSEFEIYGTYLKNFYPDKYAEAKIATMCHGERCLKNRKFNKETMLEIASENPNKDMMSFEFKNSFIRQAALNSICREFDVNFLNNGKI